MRSPELSITTQQVAFVSHFFYRNFLHMKSAIIFCLFFSLSPLVIYSQNSKVSLADAIRNIPGSKGERFYQAMTKEGMSLVLYSPKGKDDQRPHKRDEVYIVAKGSGRFFDGSKTYDFATGDVLYVPAGVEHRFETFSDDFLTWVVFYGPEK
jgi:mannose-6-phosphate isomerase-like protein (cupin superfamily)